MPPNSSAPASAVARTFLIGASIYAAPRRPRSRRTRSRCRSRSVRRLRPFYALTRPCMHTNGFSSPAQRTPASGALPRELGASDRRGRHGRSAEVPGRRGLPHAAPETATLNAAPGSRQRSGDRVPRRADLAGGDRASLRAVRRPAVGDTGGAAGRFGGMLGGRPWNDGRDQGVQPADVGVHALAEIIYPPPVLTVDPVRETGQQRRDRRKVDQRVHTGIVGTPVQSRQ